MNWRSGRGEDSVGQDLTSLAKQQFSNCFTSQGEFSNTLLPNVIYIRNKPTQIYLSTFEFKNKLRGADTTTPTELKYGVDKIMNKTKFQYRVQDTLISCMESIFHFLWNPYMLSTKAGTNTGY